ncbi:MAG: hypothetical protein DHS20C15_00850 [Planctomycetota bacterium]|nr:MAG: hypothetical protein DHS20C15_00850 [Planctomycetota bacterium]
MAALGGAACVAPPREFTTFDVGELELNSSLSVAVHPGAPQSVDGEVVENDLAREVALELQVWPKDPVELELISAPMTGADQGALLEVSLRWVDFLGLAPTSFGRSIKTFRPFGDDQVFSQAERLSRVFRFELEEPEARVLARRLTITARLHPLDLVAAAAERRTGGARVDFPKQQSYSLRRVPAQDLEACLSDPAAVEPDELFLAAVHEAHADPHARVGRLVEALPGASGMQREALFGALHFLTDATQGRSVTRWQAWWETRQGALEVGASP